jgi:hypothetical protein
MAAFDTAMISKILNALTPTGAVSVPGTALALNASAMKLRLASVLSTPAAAGTEIGTQTSGIPSNYTTGGGWALTTASTASVGGLAVGVPGTNFSFVSAGGSVASPGIYSFDLTDNAGMRIWFGPFNAGPVLVGSGNSFQITGGVSGAAGIQISLA